mmetsp:Transcript_57568/g.171671  ORF Transcript_57568/g.171671 Transcript_57568/m.171671 type:complete len:97 (+) Transcript_57568:431-721(+)
MLSRRNLNIMAVVSQYTSNLCNGSSHDLSCKGVRLPSSRLNVVSRSRGVACLDDFFGVVRGFEDGVDGVAEKSATWEETERSHDEVSVHNLCAFDA